MRLVHPIGGLVDGGDVLGSRGAGLARMAGLDVPIAPGFVVSTAAWHLTRLPGHGATPSTVGAQIDVELDALQVRAGRVLDDPHDPLLLTVTASSTARERRPEAVVMDVGLSDVTVGGLAARTNSGFAWRAYRDLLRTFSARVYELDASDIEAAQRLGGPDPECHVAALKALVSTAGRDWPQRTRDQLEALVQAMMLAAPEPTAVVVQARIFGAAARPSGVGVVFTRDPVAGAVGAFGEFRPGADWSSDDDEHQRGVGIDRLAWCAPEAARLLAQELAAVEAIHRDMCEVEFTLETGRLFLHDARPGPRSSLASIQIAVDLVDAGLIDVEAAIARIPLCALADLERPVVSRSQTLHVLARGEVAAPGVAIGRLTFPSSRGEQVLDGLSGRIRVCADLGDVRCSADDDDAGVVLSCGSPAGASAALVRRLRRPAICASAGLDTHEGTEVTLDATSGILYAGAAILSDPTPDLALARLLGWVAGGSALATRDSLPPGATVVDVPPNLRGAGAALAVAQQAQPQVPLWVRLPAWLDGDLQPPPGLWAGVIRPSHLRWAADLLAWRLSLANRWAAPEAPAADPGS